MYLFLSLHFILVTGFKPEFKFHHNNLLFTSFAFSSSLNWLSVEHKLRRRNVNILDDGERSLSYSLLPYALQSWLQKKMLNFPWQYQLFVAANWKLLLPIWFSKKEVTGHCSHRPSKPPERTSERRSGVRYSMLWEKLAEQRYFHNILWAQFLASSHI